MYLDGPSEISRIVIPTTVRQRILDFYHNALKYSGESRMYQTMRHTLYWPGMKVDMENYMKSCETCKSIKQHTISYSKIPLAKPETVAWQTMHIDIVRPYGADRRSALTMIDAASCWVKIVPIPDRSSTSIAAAFNQLWLC